MVIVNNNCHKYSQYHHTVQQLPINHFRMLRKRHYQNFQILQTRVSKFLHLLNNKHCCQMSYCPYQQQPNFHYHKQLNNLIDHLDLQVQTFLRHSMSYLVLMYCNIDYIQLLLKHRYQQQPNGHWHKQLPYPYRLTVLYQMPKLASIVKNYQDYPIPNTCYVGR